MAGTPTPSPPRSGTRAGSTSAPLATASGASRGTCSSRRPRGQWPGSGRFRPGARSDPRKLQGVSTTSAQTRTDDKKSLHDVSPTGITTIREGAAHQVNGMAVQTEVGSSQHHVDKQTIQQKTTKFLHNCGLA